MTTRTETPTRAEATAASPVVWTEIPVRDLDAAARFYGAVLGVALTEHAGPRAQVLLQLLGVPAIVNVVGGFRWAAPADVALLQEIRDLLRK